MEAKKTRLILEIEGVPAHLYNPAQEYASTLEARTEAVGIVERFCREMPSVPLTELQFHVTTGHCDADGNPEELGAKLLVIAQWSIGGTLTIDHVVLN